MSNEIQVFENAEFGSIRTIEIDGDVWFVGKDIADVLGYSRPDHAIKKHVDEEDKELSINYLCIVLEETT